MNRTLRDKWAEAERTAVQAEAKVARIGQAGAHPQVAELLAQASTLRAEADRKLRELIAAEHLDRQQP